MKPTAHVIHDNTLGPVVHLEAGELSASIATKYGGNLYEFTVGDHKLIEADHTKLAAHQYVGTPVLWPYPNRIQNRTFMFRGETFSMEEYPQRVSDKHLIHGVVHEAEWQSEVLESDDSGAKAKTWVEWNEHQPYFSSFPCKSRLTHTHILSDTGLRIEYLAENLDTAAFEMGYALHPSFTRLSGNDKTKLLIPAQYVAEATHELLPTGIFYDVTRTTGDPMHWQFDFNRPKPIGGVDIDHLFSNLTPGINPRIDYETLGISLEVAHSSELSRVVCHTLANTIELELQSCDVNGFKAADPVNAGIIVLEPGQSVTGFTEYKIHTNIQFD